MIKLLPYDLKITGSNHKNTLLQGKVRLYIMDLFPGPYIDGSFVHKVALFILVLGFEL